MKKHRIEGMCAYCGTNKSMSEKTYCECCQQKWLAYQRKRREENLRNNTCIYCKNKTISGSRSCQVCKIKQEEARRKNKDLVFAQYGGYRCVCCGETEPMFLTIDHIDGGGNEHRRNSNRADIHPWLIKHNFPAGFQVLCYNCNCGRYRNGGVCPHQITSELSLKNSIASSSTFTEEALK